MKRTLPLLLLAALLAAPQARALTEPEDRPFPDPDESEDNAIAAAEKVPWSLAGFATAFPDHVVQIRGQLGALDRDFYSVQLGSGQLLLASVFEPGGGERSDLAVGIFAPGASVPLATDDDGGTGLLPAIAQPVSQSGTWKVAVTGFADASFTGSHQEARSAAVPYELVLAIASNPPAHRDLDLSPGPQGANDAPGGAQALPRGGAVLQGSLLPGDVDHYSIQLEAGDVLTAAVVDLETGELLSSAGERNDPILGLFDPGGSPQETRSDDEGPGLLSHLRFASTQSGTWKLAVSGFGDGTFTGAHQHAAFDYALVTAVTRACPEVEHVMTITAPPPSGNPYTLADLDEGDHYYTDRFTAANHVLVHLPSEIRCAQWIRTANDDRNRTDAVFLQLALDRSTRLYVGFDTRATSPPSWLGSAFTDSGRFIDIEDPDPVQEFRLYRRDFPPGSVVLGGNRASGAVFPGESSNYVVAAVPFAAPDGQLVLSGSALGGNVSVTILGVLVQVDTTAGQTAAQVVAALASAINGNATLQSQGVGALAIGTRLESSSDFDSFAVNDAGLAGAPIPALPLLLAALLAGALLLTSRRASRLARAAGRRQSSWIWAKRSSSSALSPSSSTRSMLPGASGPASAVAPPPSTSEVRSNAESSA